MVFRDFFSLPKIMCLVPISVCSVDFVPKSEVLTVVVVEVGVVDGVVTCEEKKIGD